MASIAVNVACGIIRAGVEMSDVCIDIYNICKKSTDFLALKVMRVFIRVVVLIAYACGIGAFCSGASYSTLFDIKAVEVLTRIIEVPIQIALATSEALVQASLTPQFIAHAILK